MIFQILNVSPDIITVKAIQKIAWSASVGSLDLVHLSNDDIHKAVEQTGSPITPDPEKVIDPEDMVVCREALEVLTVCLAVCPLALDNLNKDKAWQTFIIDLLLLSKSK